MNMPTDLFYSKTHEWVALDDGVITVGITDFAQNQLSDLTFVELPEVDGLFKAREEAAVVESVKAAADVYAPLSGEIIAVNEDLEDAPELINKDPYGAGWIFKMKVDDESDVDLLMDAESYEELFPGDE